MFLRPIPSNLICDKDGTDDGIYDDNWLILKRKNGFSMNGQNDGIKSRRSSSSNQFARASALIFKGKFVMN